MSWPEGNVLVQRGEEIGYCGRETYRLASIVPPEIVYEAIRRLLWAGLWAEGAREWSVSASKNFQLLAF